MMKRTENKQIKFHMITIENRVPENHFLRKLDRLDFYEAQERSRLERSGAIKPQRAGRVKKEKAKVQRPSALPIQMRECCTDQESQRGCII